MRRIVLLWVIIVVVLNPQGRARQRAPRKHCPPHTPAITISVPEGGYQTECLVCGKRGPRRENSVEAKEAFDAILGVYRLSGILSHRNRL